KKPVNAIAIVGIVLGGIDATLGGDRVRPPRAILIAEALHLITQFRQGRGSGPARQTRSDHDDIEFAFVGRVDQFQVILVVRPSVSKWPFRRVAVEWFGGDLVFERASG